MTDAIAARSRLLARIADALDCPVEAFADRAGVSGQLARAAALLTSFERLSEVDQERAVAFVQALAAGECPNTSSVPLAADA